MEQVDAFQFVSGLSGTIGLMTTRIETILYDADGNRTDDDAAAVRAETVELDADGNVVNTHAHDSLAWKVDPISLEGDAPEARLTGGALPCRSANSVLA